MRNKYWRNKNRRAKTSLNKYTSHFICNVCVWEGVGDWTKTAIYWPPLLWPSALCLSRSLGLLHRRPVGPASLGHVLIPASSHQLVAKTQSGVPRGPSAGGGFPYHILSPTRLIYNSSSPSYIIVQSPNQSPTQSLEWHVWSSSSGNNCHAVQSSLSSGASVYECIMGFYLVPFHQPNPPTRFLSITDHWNVSLPSGASLWNGMFGRVEGQYTTAIRGTI